MQLEHFLESVLKKLPSLQIHFPDVIMELESAHLVQFVLLSHSEHSIGQLTQRGPSS